MSGRVELEQPQTATEPRVGARWVAAAMLIAAAVAGVLGHMLLPRMLVWLLVGILVWAALTTWWRTVDHRIRTLPSDDAPRPLELGETYDTAVKLTFAPNVPLAEAICTRLHANGIEAFYKRTPTFGTIWAGTSDFEPVEVWVGEHDLDRARALLPPQ